MRNQTLARSVATGALAAAMAGAGAGTAAAGPPEDRGPARSVTGFASAVLIGDETPNMAVFFDVYDAEDRDSDGALEVFVKGYECLTEDRVPATVSGLESATAAGTLDLVCGSPDGEHAGTATVNLTWTGQGEIERYTLARPTFSCIGFGEERQALVTGSVHVQIPGLVLDESTTPDDTYSRLTRVEALCPPARK